MAKGNDGNYLQHSVEVAVAVHLAAKHPDGRLHVALAHGMAPFEPCGKVPDGQTRALLHDALRAAQECPKAGESSIVTAYRKTKASLENYPNTGELLRGVIGRHQLSGGITEVNCLKHAQLKDAWSGSCVTPIRCSWRDEVRPGGVLMSPVPLSAPWLFTMDPMTYCEGGDHDDDKLYRADFLRVSAAVSSFVESRQPGVAALFVYAVKPEARPQFWAFVDDLARETKTTAVSCWLLHQGGNRNLVALLCSAFDLPPDWLPHGLNAGR